MASTQLKAPLSYTSGIVTPENTSPTKKLDFTPNDGIKAPAYSTERLRANNSVQKVYEEMEISKKKILEKIQEIDHQIYVQKLPFLQYYDPITEKIKSQQEITNVIHKSFDFFQADPSLFKGSQYKPESYFFYNSKPKNNLTQPTTRKVSIADFNTPERGQKVKKEVEFSTEKKSVKPYLKQFYAKGSTGEGSLKEDDEVFRLSEEGSTQIETAPSIKQIPSGEKTLREERSTELRTYEKEKIPVGLYKGTLKRKIILEEIKKTNNKTLERRGSDIQVLKAVEARPGIKNLSTLVKERTDEIVDTPRKAKEINLKTRSPVNNAFYQVLVMPSTQRDVIGKKLNLPLEKLGTIKRKDWKSSSVRDE